MKRQVHAFTPATLREAVDSATAYGTYDETMSTSQAPKKKPAVVAAVQHNLTARGGTKGQAGKVDQLLKELEEAKQKGHYANTCPDRPSKFGEKEA